MYFKDSTAAISSSLGTENCKSSITSFSSVVSFPLLSTIGMLMGLTLHFERTRLVNISPLGISLREYITTPIPTLLASEKQKNVVFSGSKCIQDFSLSVFSWGNWLYHCSNLLSISSGNRELQNSLVTLLPCSLLRFIASLIRRRHFNTKGLLNPIGS